MASLTVGALPMAFQSLSLSSSRLAFPRSQILGVSLSTTSASLCLFSSPPTFPSVIYCGRGDKRTAKGKRFKHSFGNARPRNKKKGRGPPRVPVPPSGPRKDKFDDGEIVKIEIDESLFSS
ncbi:small ribosomal subunit protein bTHXc [Magnolia sinica]|uniref:small ribosomal subunit protein bTHXc n=1 Tax=Magnolia sinica TaxID=86752 RepID=UPI0026580501|nr:small ribosomal subunit protein bTHXc [Magnolia sinica]